MYRISCFHNKAPSDQELISVIFIDRVKKMGWKLKQTLLFLLLIISNNTLQARKKEVCNVEAIFWWLLLLRICNKSQSVRRVWRGLEVHPSHICVRLSSLPFPWTSLWCLYCAYPTLRFFKMHSLPQSICETNRYLQGHSISYWDKSGESIRDSASGDEYIWVYSMSTLVHLI